MFTDTDCLVLNKYDMLPYFDFNEERAARDYRGVNPEAPLFCVSAKTGEGMDELAAHIARKIRQEIQKEELKG